MLPDSEGGLAAGRSEWSFIDFVLIWLGGFLGTGVFLAIGFFLADDETLVVFGLAGQYVGNLGVFWLLKRQKTEADVGFVIESGDLRYLALGLGLQLLLGLALLPLSQLLFPDGAPAQQVADMLTEADSTFLRLSLIVGAVLLAPVAEELMFRGVLIRSMSGRPRRTIIVVTATLFALVHLGEFIGQDDLFRSAAVFLPPIFILGIVLAWVTLRTGRLGPAIFLHSGWNLLAALVLIIPPELLEQASG